MSLMRTDFRRTAHHRFNMRIQFCTVMPNESVEVMRPHFSRKASVAGVSRFDGRYVPGCFRSYTSPASAANVVSTTLSRVVTSAGDMCSPQSAFIRRFNQIFVFVAHTLPSPNHQYSLHRRAVAALGRSRLCPYAELTSTYPVSCPVSCQGRNACRSWSGCKVADRIFLRS